MNGQGLLAEARELLSRLVGLRRDFHAHPELGLEETRTADRVQEELAALGIPSERRGTAVVGLIEGAAPGPCVALRADMDALPIEEPESRPWRSTAPGKMHACGHDAHTTIQLGAARLLAARRGSLRGSVKLLFQPAEETVGGAADMVAAGCLESPRVERVYGLHVMPYLPVGAVETRRGALNGCSATLKVEVTGKGAHGAYPETGIDAVLAAANVVMSLNALIGRSLSPLEDAVLSVGVIEGGSASNIIAEKVRLRATLRATSDATRAALIDKARTMAEGIASGYGASAVLEASLGYAALVNHDAAVDEIAAVAAELLGPEALRWKAKPSLGVEDFSYFIEKVPGAFYHLGCGNEAKGVVAPLHSAAFDIDEDCLPIGAALQARLALRHLEFGGEGMTP